MASLNVALLQMNTQDDKRANLQCIADMIDQAACRRVQFVCMPERVNYIGPSGTIYRNAETIPGGPTSELYRQKAMEYGLWIHGGSICEKIPGNDGHVFNTTVVFNPQGEMVAKYRKIHLYDVDVEGNISFKESNVVKPGDDIVCFETDFGTMGLAICYDLRFPELYRILALKGARLIFNPAEFNLHTGKDHWETLLRARAIENVCYMVAPAQYGTKASFPTFGRSMVVDPWGNVIAKASDRECVVTAEIDLDYVTSLRQQIPCLRNRRPDVYSSYLCS